MTKPDIKTFDLINENDPYVVPINDPTDDEKAQVIGNGDVFMSLWRYIEHVLPMTNGSSLPALRRLIEDGGLIIYDKTPIEYLDRPQAQIIPSEQLLAMIEHEDSFENFRSCVVRSDIANAYKKLGENHFKWLGWDDKHVKLKFPDAAKTKPEVSGKTEVASSKELEW